MKQTCKLSAAKIRFNVEFIHMCIALNTAIRPESISVFAVLRGLEISVKQTINIFNYRYLWVSHPAKLYLTGFEGIFRTLLMECEDEIDK